jgi:hypothetical protein
METLNISSFAKLLSVVPLIPYINPRSIVFSKPSGIDKPA